MLIGGLVKTSLIDYPEKIAAVVFLNGCNFRCPYCHNSDIVLHLEERVYEDEFFRFLNSRKGKLDAVVVSGGEPCLNSCIKEFIKKIKDTGFLVKLDTNGSRPDVLEEIVKNGLVDYVAMDIKGPLERYKEITNSDIDETHIIKSMEILSKSGINFEYRTTVVEGMLDFDDFLNIKDMFLRYGAPKVYYLQKFVPSKTIDAGYLQKNAPCEGTLKKIVEIFSEIQCKCLIR